MTSTSPQDIDTEFLREKYREERDKRLRADANDQYIEIVGDFAEHATDPYADPVEREPLFDEVTVAFVGGGFAGLTTGARLVEAGIDVRIIEKGGDVGGTWYWNRYPGAQCDTASMVYMPLLEETGHMPTEKYAKGAEILEHSQRIARHYNLYENALFSTEVTEVEWDDDASRWIIRTDRGDEMRAKYIAIGTGPLHRPKLPGIPGVGSFEGHTFHTSRWDYDYTGGDSKGALMTGLADKRVGIIGTGATSVQAVPHLSKACQELFVFQRTPSSIDIRNNHAIDPEWFATLEEGWQQKWLENFTILQTMGFAEEDFVKDGWTDITKRIVARLLAEPEPDLSPAGRLRAYYASDDEKMTEIRARVDEIVSDEATAEALKPWYRQLCKRPCFHDEYLDAYNNPTTHLVDTDGKGVERIDETGVWVGDTHYELDCLIYASGFEVGTSFKRRWGFEPVGRDGQGLFDKWEKGMVSLHGTHVHGFPNMFIVGPYQAANLISNVPHNLVERGRTLAAVIGHAEQTGAATVEPTLEAETAWIELLENGERRFGNDVDCTPGYYNNEGQLFDDAGVRNGLGYPDGAVAYFSYIDEWRTSGAFEGLTFSDPS